MKRFFIYLILFSFIIGCGRSFQVIVKDDPFKKTKVVKVEMWHDVIDGSLDNTATVYNRDIKNGKKLPVIINMEFQSGKMSVGGDQGGKLDKKAYISVDDKNFNVKLKDIVSEKKTDYYGRETYTGGTTSTINVNAQNWKQLKCKIKLTPAIEEAIINANKYLIRIYYGGNPTTLQATPDQLAKVKEFLQYGTKIK